jgi:hypothetical protein
MLRSWVFVLVVLTLYARPAGAQSYPSPWLQAVVGSAQSKADELPNARRVTSASAVRALGEISVVVNSPQVRAQKTFRPKREGETPYEYLKAAVDEAIRTKLHLKIPQGIYPIRVPDTSSARAHIELKKAQDVVLDFQGSTLIFQDVSKGGFSLTNSRRVTISNARMWWSGLSHVMGSIEGSPGNLRIKIHPDYLPHVEQSSLLQRNIHSVVPARRDFPYLWDLGNYNQEYHNPSDGSEFVFSSDSGSYVPNRADILAAFTVGQSVLVQNKKFGANAFHVTGGSDLTIRGCTIGHTPGMALFSPAFERGFAWVDNKIEPISHPLHVTTTADGVHLRNIGRDFLIQGSTFRGTTDDPINVYGGLSEVVSVESDTTFVVRARQISSDVKLLAPKREVLFIDDQVMGRGRASIVSVEPVSKSMVRIVTSRPLPSVRAGHSAFTRESVPRGGMIRNNTIYGVRARAGIVLQAVSTNVIGNTIRYTTGPAIISGGFQNWYVEGPLVANARIRDNVIGNVGLAPFFRRFNLRGAISVGTGTKDLSEGQVKSNHKAHWGVAVVGNRIADSGAPGIQVQDAHTVWIRENQIVPPSDPPYGDLPAIEVKNVCGAQVRGNVFPGKSEIRIDRCE